MFSISLCLLWWSSTLGRSYLPFQDLVLPPSSAFYALFDSLSSPILYTCPAHIILLPATFIFRCLFSTPSSSFYLLGLLYIFFGPSCFLQSASSPPVSLSVPVFPTRIYRLVPRRLPTLFLLDVSLVFCPT